MLHNKMTGVLLAVESGQENLPILLAALTKCTFWSEDISNALLEVIIFFLWAIDYHYVQNELPLKPKMHFPYDRSIVNAWVGEDFLLLLIIVKFKVHFP